MLELLAIVPARSGSRGVVRKNMRELNGKPLIAHTVDALQEAGVERIVISSDDMQVLGWAGMHGVEHYRRPERFATDQATIADVAGHIIEATGWQGIIGVFQPTSPLRSAGSIRLAWDHFDRNRFDSLASVVVEPHLCWFDEDGHGLAAARALFRERVNRQFTRQTIWRETGAIQFVKADVLRQTGSMVAERHQLFEIDPREADDIDTPEDLDRVRSRALDATVVFRLTANRRVGSGHLHHCLQLAEYLDIHRLVFLLKECDDFVGEHLEQAGWDYRVESDLSADLQALDGGGANLIVNDVLDTTVADVLAERVAGFRVVCIEDLGPGAVHADWVVNALYPAPEVPSKRIVTGARYATLRPEFLDLPDKVIEQSPRRVLITFGGTDPGHLAKRVVWALSSLQEVDLTLIQGSAAESFIPPADVVERTNVANMAEEMWRSDLVITAAGRTIYEAAATGTPVIAIAQSAREATHAHLSLDAGVISLGLGVLVDDELIRNTAARVLDDYQLRVELSLRLKSSIDPFGAQRIAAGIESIMRGLR